MQQRSVLVTAGGSGIGYAIAERFAADGSRVWITDVDEVRLGQAPKSWWKTRTDAADEAGVDHLFAEIGKNWGRLDVLCANAGIAGPTAEIESVDLADWRRCVAVNLEGAFLAARGAAPVMKSQGSGVMIFTSSTAGMYGFPYRSPYAAAKWGIVGLMKTVAMELGRHGIRANAVCPGPVEGKRMEGVILREAALKGMSRDMLHAGYAEGNSMKSWATAEDIARAVSFLASDDARMISGLALPVDGHTENPNPKC